VPPNAPASACERLLSVPLFHSMTAEQVNCIAAALMKIAGAK
jgi:hypothetical protein